MSYIVDIAVVGAGPCGLGVGAALLVTRLMRTLLYEVQPADPVTFAAVIGVLAVAAFVAAASIMKQEPREAPVILRKCMPLVMHGGHN